jgi:type II secretory pathway component GspD/PulD (secretin)
MKHVNSILFYAFIGTVVLFGGCFFGHQHEQKEEPQQEQNQSRDANFQSRDRKVSESEPEKPLTSVSGSDNSTVVKKTAEKPVEKPNSVSEPPVKKIVAAEPVIEKPIIEEPIIKKPIVEKPTIEEPIIKKPAEKSDAGVNTTSPVKTESPVNTTSPVKQDAPVKQDSPVHNAPVSFIPVLLRAAFFAAVLNQTTDGSPQTADGRRQTVEKQETVNTETRPTESRSLNSESSQSGIRFNFRYAPWKEVIEWFADQAGLSLQADNVPQGTLNLTDNKIYTPAEAIDILNSYLLFKEYTILRKGKSLFVIYLPDGIPPNLLEPITAADLDSRGKYELCRCVFNLSRTTPDIIQAEAEKLLGPQGSIALLPKSQQIIITETGGTLRTIRDIIKRIDDPDDVASGKIQIIEPKNLSADEALSVMRKLLSIEESDTSLRTATDVSGTRIWMSGRGDMVERAKEIIKTLDDSYLSNDPATEGQLQFEVHNPGTADPAAVLAVLQTLLAGISDVRLSLDPKTNGIAALGRPANHATIRETIKQMQLNEPVVEVIPLKRLSPASAVDSIKKFFATSTVDSSASTSSSSKNQVQAGVPAPTVEADITARQIIVRGTAPQIADIRSLLLKLGEDGTGGRTASKETIRTIPLSPATAALVLDQLKEVWPKLEKNEIKVVVPSGMVPAKSVNGLSKPESVEPVKKEGVDDLIEKTYQTVPPQTFNNSRANNPRADNSRADNSRAEGVSPPIIQYRTVQYTEQKTIEPKIEPQYQPINTPEKQSEEKKNLPVVVSNGPNGLMISSDDPEALDKLEELIRMLSDETVLGKTKLTVYYLKNATAEVVAQTLQTLMGTTSSAAGGVSGTGTTDTSLAFDGEQRAALLSMLSPSNSIEKTGPVSISADARLNALLIQANAVDHKTIEMLLPILDQASIPGGEINRNAVPRLIPLKNMRAEEAQTAVEKIFADRLKSGTSGTSTSGQPSSSSGRSSRSSSSGSSPFGGMPPMMPGMMPGMPPGGPMGMMQQMMSQMGRGGQSSTTAKEPEPTMTLGTDSRSNSLIVSAPVSLFNDVKAFVEELDAYAAQSETVVEVVQLKDISPALAQQTISNLAGDSVKFTTSAMSSSRSSSGGFGSSPFGSSRFGSSGFGSSPFGGGFGSSGFGSSNPFMNIMRGGSSFGGAPSGVSPFGGSTRPGGFGSSFGTSGSSPFGGSSRSSSGR